MIYLLSYSDAGLKPENCVDRKGCSSSRGMPARNERSSLPLIIPKRGMPTRTLLLELALLLNFRLFALLDKNVVRDGVPGIVNANEKEQQRRAARKE